MKYAFMSFSCPQMGLGELIATAKRFGYDGIEPRVVSEHKHGIEPGAGKVALAAARKQAAEAGVDICCVATSCKYADPQTVEQQIEDTHRSIDLAADVGSPRIRVFGGELPEGFSRSDAIDQLVNALQAVADHAADRGVAVCMETHDHWCNPTHVAEAMTRVDRPAIAVNWDIMHPVRAGGVTMDEAYRQLKPWVRHVHFHDGVDSDGRLVLKPIGQGVIDHRRAVELLGADGYDGFLSGEWIGWDDYPYQVHLPGEIETMKGYEAESR